MSENETSIPTAPYTRRASTAQRAEDASNDDDTANRVDGEGQVDFDLEIGGHDRAWTVRHVSISEGLNRVASCVVEAHYRGHMEVAELLSSEVVLEMTSGEHRRFFKGIVWHARVQEEREGVEVELHVVPALQLLTQRSRSRIFQNLTVPEVFKRVYSEALDVLSRTLQNDLQATYESREYIVQYQESELAFLSRLAEEEGFFWYFNYEGDRETLVLVDSSSGLPRARPRADGRVDHVDDLSNHTGEYAFGLHCSERIGATDVVVAGFDWTHPTLQLRNDEQTGRAPGSPALEVYDHTEAVTLHRFNGEQYNHNTAAAQARMRADLLDLGRESWEMGSNVLTAQPGYTIEVGGCHRTELDQTYLIVSNTAHGGSAAGSGKRGSWNNSLRLVPTGRPYRPARTTPRPSVQGFETATVVGDGGEIHTDVHGRVRVHFHWDREHAPLAEDSSCWMRVMQSWAGPGFGTFLLPRVGMEVVVGFLGGNPDQPFVTGCLYNGDNHVRVDLPAKKTQSLIRTKSSPNSNGFNEMRFEDEAGNEFIYIHAEKDFNEVVENNHSTHVKNCQTNTVDVDQTETVKRDQTLTVERDRTKTVEKNETNVVQLTRDTTIGQDGGDEKLWVLGKREEQVDGAHDKLTVTAGNKETTCRDGHWHVNTKQRFRVIQNGTTSFTLEDQAVLRTPGNVDLTAGDGAVHLLAYQNGNLRVNAVGLIKLETPDKLQLKVGSSTITLTPDAIEIDSPTVKINGGNLVDIQCGGEVKIKS